jgi:hypothetical protein
MSNNEWVPTPKLRFVERAGVPILQHDNTKVEMTVHVLQQWFSQDVPGYMRKDAEGEWRDVLTEAETAP